MISDLIFDRIEKRALLQLAVTMVTVSEGTVAMK